MTNLEALSYWHKNTYSFSDMRQVMAELEELKVLAATLQFNCDASITVTVTKKFSERCNTEGHLPALLDFFGGLHRETGGKLFSGSIIVWAEDCFWENLSHFSRRVPILAFGATTSEKHCLLMPDPAFLSSKGYSKERSAIEEMNQIFPWHMKQPTIFWRGNSTGPGLTDDDWQKVPRIALCLKAKEINDTRAIDVGLSNLTPFSKPEHETRILDLDIVRGFVPFFDFLKYRYQIDVDGFANAWISCFTKLASHALTLKITSTQRQWYYDRLVPWKHFIPVAEDSTNLREILDWLRNHDAEAHTIADNAFSLTSDITFTSESKNMIQLLCAVLARQV